MLGLSIEDSYCWNRPTLRVIPIDDFSDFKKQLICEKFGVNSIEELKVGSFVDVNDERTTVVEIEE
jgi:hypothetical protein